MTTSKVDYQKLFEKPVINYFKCLLALHFTREALADLVELELAHLLTPLNIPTEKSCSACSSDDVAGGKTCPNNLCDKVASEIKRRHRYRNPSWANSAPQSWYHPGVWQIAKCFMPSDTNTREAPTKTEIDFNGVINVIINCTLFDNFFLSDTASNLHARPIPVVCKKVFSITTCILLYVCTSSAVLLYKDTL